MNIRLSIVAAAVLISLMLSSCSGDGTKEKNPEEQPATTVKVPSKPRTVEILSSDTNIISISKPELIIRSNVIGMTQRVFLLKAEQDMKIHISIIEEDTSLYFAFLQENKQVAGPDLQTFDGNLKKGTFYGIQIGYGNDFAETERMSNFTLSIRKTSDK